ncbi:MAG: hypothetical protein HY663_03700 [Chloroflexi bacterium]|nr:hypothetical protein [Chloroflexota bacterium]
MYESVDETIYEKLKKVARAKELTNYAEIGLLVGLEPHNSILWAMLDNINRYEHSQRRPMLSSVVIVQAENRPGSGFWESARGLGLFQNGDESIFWIEELKKVWDYWSSH